MASQSRDGSIWRFTVSGGFPAIDAGSARRIAELDPPGRDGQPVGPGVWETSGIIDASGVLGGDDGDGRSDIWLFDVQAHPPTTPPNQAQQVEDGQLLLLWGLDGHDD